MYTGGKMGSRCEVVKRIETPRMGMSDGNPPYGSVTCYITSQLRPGRPLAGLPSVGVYTCMYLRMYIHGCICMRVCGWDWVSYMDYEGLQRLKKGYRIDIVKWMCATRDWVCVRT